MQRINNEKGYSLLLSIVLIVVISIIGLSLLTISASSMKQVDKERTHQGVYYIAEAGLTLATKDIKKQIQLLEQQALGKVQQEIQSTPFLSQQQLEDLYQIELRKLLTESNLQLFPKEFEIATNKTASISYSLEVAANRVSIESVGKVDGIERHLTRVLKLQSQLFGEPNLDPPPVQGSVSRYGGFGAIVEETIEFNEGFGKVEGKMSAGKSVIDKAANFLNQDLIYTNSYERPLLLGWKPKKLQPPITFDSSVEALRFPDEQFAVGANLPVATSLPIRGLTNGKLTIDRDTTWDIADNVKLKSLIVEKTRDLTINVGSRTVNLYVDELDLKNGLFHGEIFVTGSGRLNIYVNQTAVISHINKDKNVHNVNLYYQGTTPIEFMSNSHVTATVYNKTANFVSEGNFELKGNLITYGKQVEWKGISDSFGQYIIAPNATVTVSAWGDIRGLVVAKNLIVRDWGDIIAAKATIEIPGLQQPIQLPSKANSSVMEESTFER